MSQADLTYISDTLLASAFYFGVMGGIVGAGLFLFIGVVYRVALRFFKGR